MRKSLLIAYGLLLLVAVGSYALLGWHVRMLADDYCTAAEGLAFGPLGAAVHNYNNWSGLVVNAFVKGALAYVQPAYHQVQTLILLVALGAALWGLVREIGAAVGLAAMRAYSGLIALVLLLLLVYTVPNARMIYWHAVIIPYSLPVALILAALAALIRWARRGFQHTDRYAGFLVLVAVTLMGTANTFFLPLIGTLALGTIYAMWRLPAAVRREALMMIAAVGLVSLAGFGLVFSAPGNAVRQAAVLATTGYSPPSILELIPLIFVNMWVYLTFPYGHSLIYAFAAFGIGVVVTLALGKEDAQRIARFPLSTRWAWADALALLALSGGVTLATVITTSYGVGLLAWHTMFLPRVVQALCMIALGYMATVWLARRGFPSVQIKRRLAYRAVRLALIGLMVALPLGALANNLSRLPDFQAYAQDWDRVHAQILAEVAAGNRGVIEVPPYRYSLAVFLYLDEIDQPESFTRRCAAGFYGVEEIIMPPIQNPPRLGYRPLSQP